MEAIASSLGLAKSWADNKQAGKAPWRPWFSWAWTAFFALTVLLLGFWASLTVVWEPEPIMSYSFNHTDTSLYRKWEKDPCQVAMYVACVERSESHPTVLNNHKLPFGGTYYTSNGLFPWTIIGAITHDENNTSWEFMNRTTSIEQNQFYSGANLSYCRATSVILDIDLASVITQATIEAKCNSGGPYSYLRLSTTWMSTKEVKTSATASTGIASTDGLAILHNIAYFFRVVFWSRTLKRFYGENHARMEVIADPVYAGNPYLGDNGCSGPCPVNSLSLEFSSFGVTSDGGSWNPDLSNQTDSKNKTVHWDDGLTHYLFSAAMWDFGRHDWNGSSITGPDHPAGMNSRQPPDATWLVQYLCKKRKLKSRGDIVLSLLTSVFSVFSAIVALYTIICTLIRGHPKYSKYFLLPNPHPDEGPQEEEVLLGTGTQEREGQLDNGKHNGSASLV